MSASPTIHGVSAFKDPDVEVERLPGGVIEMRSRHELSAAPVTTLHWLRRWARRTPHSVLLTEVAPDGERRALDYASAWSAIARTAVGLAEQGIQRGERVAVIATNSIESFIYGHAIMLAGAMWAPIAPQYLRPGADPARIAGVLDVVDPALIVVPDPALHAGLPDGRIAVTSMRPRGEHTRDRAHDVGDQLLAVAQDDDAVKLLLTSGSTGTPKAVVYTHRMLVSNMRATADVWPFVTDHAPVLVDWLPWNHAFGGNANIDMVLLGGGTLHIDDAHGRPQELVRTIASITEFSPTFHAAVPATFHALLSVLEADDAFRRAFFARSDALFSAGAAMPMTTFHRLRELSLTVRERPVPVLTGWGSTEVGPAATTVHTTDSEPGHIGPPLPGVTVRLVPVADKLELRVKGPGVMPGYWRAPDLTAAVFDGDGFYRSGDAGVLVDEDDPGRGFRFDGRIADDFKLANGSWVNVDRLRSSLLAQGGAAVRDVVVAGPDRPHLVAVFWVEEGARVDVDAVIGAHNAHTSGQTNLIRAAAVLPGEPPADLLSPKGLIKPAPFRVASVGLIDALYHLDAVGAKEAS
ncbi:feruloyl-CoA synthase [Microbacterium testaceum]|nr:feruloyl-CoA synthase [Microbacterium sp. SORGH_AS_0969]MDQ1114381.1 feruloyl-CoA synthase [Microbacterium testaceum]